MAFNYTETQMQNPHRHSKNFNMFILFFVIFAATCLSGCKDAKKEEDMRPAAAPLEGVALRLLVVDDHGLAAAVKQNRGEWLAQTGSNLTVEEASEADFTKAGPIGADAAVCPSYMVGELAEREAIVALPESAVSQGGDDWQDIFKLERRHEAVWGGAAVAAPFGSPVLVCYCRTDILKRLGAEPPQTWSEYLRLAELLADREKLGELAPPADKPWHGTIEPLGSGWAGLTLLAHAAPLAKHADNYSTLFDIKTMRPLIGGPPFVRALEEMVRLARLNKSVGFSHDPDSAREAFWQGQCGLAITWPTAAAEAQDEKSPESGSMEPKKTFLPCTPIELPGSREVYNIDELRWTAREKHDEIRVPLLATTGRMGVVSRESANPQAAAQLLLWLSGKELAPPVSTKSPRTTLYRESQLRLPQQWVEPQMSLESALVYGDVVEKAFDRQQWVFALRIPARAEYLSALDEAVEAAILRGKSPKLSLREAALRWRAITEKHGKEKQLRAYRKSLELRP